MTILLIIITNTFIISGIIFQNTNLFWTAGLFAILSLIFWIYSHVKDVMPEPMAKHEKTYIIQKVARQNSIPAMGIPEIKK